MSSGLNIVAGGRPSGWVLVESQLNHQGRQHSSSLLVERRSRPGHTEEIPLPIFLDGRIREVVRLPDDVSRMDWQGPKTAGAESPRLKFRPVGWVERNVRMAVRVLRTYRRISDQQRKESGLSLWRALSDLPGAYRSATAFRAPYPVLDYADWIRRFDTLRPADALQIQAHIANFTRHPHFRLLLVEGAGGKEAVQVTLTSLHGQLYRNFTCAVLDSTGALQPEADPEFSLQHEDSRSQVVTRQSMPAWLAEFNSSLAASRMNDEWVMLLRAGDTLPAHALYWYACEIQSKPDVAVFYSDDDALDAEGHRTQPRLKPDWSPTHLHSTNYIGAAAVFRGTDVSAAGGVSPDCCRHGNYDLLLRVIDSTGDKVAHVPAVLFHQGAVERADSAWEDPQWCAGALQMQLARKGVAASVAQTSPTIRRVRYRLPDTPPLVSVIVPTRDQAGLLRECIESLRGRTTYPRLEILIFDNQTTEPVALAYLEKLAGEPGTRVLRYNRPFNYSTINNIAAHEARGEMLCLLNNDTWVISPDWLEEMVGHLLQDRVGAVGAKLYYPDTRIQHAGVTVGPGGCADHLHIGLGYSAPGYCQRAVVAQEMSAVTGACLLTWKHLYDDLGGLREGLAVAFNDVDYCLRLQEAGHRVVFTPHAELFHHESATRGRDTEFRDRRRADREIEYMRTRWSERLKHDPYYNPNLSYQRPDFSLSETPRVKKPWL